MPTGSRPTPGPLAAALDARAAGLPDWRLDQLAGERVDSNLGAAFERRITACAYQFGMGPADVPQCSACCCATR